MAFDGITIASLVHEFKDTLEGGRISKIAQPEKDELLIAIKNNKENYRLQISASASLPLIYLTDKNKPSPMTAPQAHRKRADCGNQPARAGADH